MKKTIPNRAATIRKPAALPQENALERDSLTGGIGPTARSCPGSGRAWSSGRRLRRGLRVHQWRGSGAGEPPAESGWVQKFALPAQAGWLRLDLPSSLAESCARRWAPSCSYWH